MTDAKVDEVGPWSEVKLEIVHKYARAYSKVMAKRRDIREHIYVDAFAGAGTHISRTTGELIAGSPLNALEVDPPFAQYHLIDLDGDKAESLRHLSAGRENVFVYHGDCNRLLLEKVFPLALYEDYRRALCLLDPYGLHLDWKVMRQAGQMGSVEIFLNFPIMDMNRNVCLRDREKIDDKQADRLTRFWGDDSWKEAAYTAESDLFGYPEKRGNDDLAQAFRCRLRTAAGFSFVPDPLPMRNTSGAIVYYLFFASPNKTGGRIVEEIFAKYRAGGAT